MKLSLPSNSTAIILDDHKMFAASFEMFLERTGLFSVVQAFTSEREVLEYLTLRQPSKPMIFLDYFIPECNVTYLIGDIKRFCPAAKIIIVSSLTNPALM